ncbi:mitochondrial import inner membrane translocase subunit Tim29-like [Dreissena polymorpha]|uniref:Uncharacterized protein n=1 Tax=Dreissena polymorpha TaxID=45954 RepID=A0A9D3YCE2_DREPO|nr:mitochondrial import inner membrane translocase subunit Tim29-like [Dreissena polymorpha]KAH3696206.1 hypothetical protein DPMN_083671 [Dreissena polymorpha]
MRRSFQILRSLEKGADVVVKEAESVVEKVKESRSKRIFNYLKNIYDDYKTVGVETLQDMKKHPLKTSVYLSLLGSTMVLFKTNPGEIGFHAKLTQSLIDLMLVSDRIRNPKSEAAIDSLCILRNFEQLRCYNLGVCSLMCVRESGDDVGLYAANCKYVRPHWMEFHKTIIDVGILGHWINLEKAMVDYDIQPDEWLGDGLPNKDFKHYNRDSPVRWDMTLNK